MTNPGKAFGIDDGLATPLSSPDLYRLLSGASVDLMVRPAADGAPRFVPLRLAVPAEDGFALHRLILLRSARGSYREVHCLDPSDLSVLYAEREGEGDAVDVVAAFASAIAASRLPPVAASPRGLAVRPASSARPPVPGTEAFVDIEVRMSGIDVPGAEGRATYGSVYGGDPLPCLFVRPEGADPMEAVAAAAARAAGGGAARESAALVLVGEALGSGAASFARLCRELRGAGTALA